MDRETKRELIRYWSRRLESYAHATRIASKAGYSGAHVQMVTKMANAIGRRIRELSTPERIVMSFSGGPMDGKQQERPPGTNGSGDWLVPILRRPKFMDFITHKDRMPEIVDPGINHVRYTAKAMRFDVETFTEYWRMECVTPLTDPKVPVVLNKRCDICGGRGLDYLGRDCSVCRPEAKP